MRNKLEQILDKITGVEKRYVVRVKENNTERIVGVWKTQQQAVAHQNRMMDIGNYQEVSWSLE